MNLQETIRRVLREEVNEANLRPNENTNKLIGRWLEKLFSGSKMYYGESYKTRHDFEWCNKGLEIARVTLFFEETNDKRPTSERDFHSGTLTIPKSIIDNLITYVPIRRNYLKHKIIEWFEGNILPSMVEKMGRDDIEIDELREHPANAEVCVPPVEKPEGVTQEEMIDLILKKTLFRIDDLLKYEEEEPGYIEKLYLGKLQNAEIGRLRGGINESDPKTGTGKKPKGSGRRLYTDENPSDTVSVKFRTKEDIVDTLNKDSFKSKPHKRQSQIINLIHQRVRAAYQNAKDPETKQRLKRAYAYIETVKEKSKEKTIRLQKQKQNEGLHNTSWENDEGDKITLIDLLNATEDIPVQKISVEQLKPHLLSWDGDEEEIKKIEKSDLQYPILIFVEDDGSFISIIDGHHRAQKAVRKGLDTIKTKIIPINSLPKNIRKVFSHMGKQEQNEGELTEKCWPGYTQKGMKTMFGKRYPNCVKKKKK